MIKVQEQDFNLAAEIAALTRGRTDIGGVVSFIGLVRDVSDGAKVAAMTLEHYPGMTEKQLSAIERDAGARWPLSASLIIHRYGRLLPGEQIMAVVTASAHRQAAFEAAEFLVDWLKTKAPFWKLESDGGAESWVAARDSDDEAAGRWEKG
ncbi:MAG: molybdenum cofactor biosynthesis protein MoaE [Alphaproteobacteria bacterium]|nr:molybdenum cofactor biosynthesis protein MoaE [Alphaproteobacteria bacterium]